MQTDRNCSQPEITFLFHTHKYRSGVRTSFFYSRSLQAIYDFFLSRWKQKTLFATHRFCNDSFSQSGFWIMRQLLTKKRIRNRNWNDEIEVRTYPLASNLQRRSVFSSEWFEEKWMSFTKCPEWTEIMCCFRCDSQLLPIFVRAPIAGGERKCQNGNYFPLSISSDHIKLLTMSHITMSRVTMGNKRVFFITMITLREKRVWKVNEFF